MRDLFCILTCHWFKFCDTCKKYSSSWQGYKEVIASRNEGLK